MKNIVIIGLGALGCAYASKLHHMDPNRLQVIAGGARARRYKEEGFLINGKHFDFRYIAPEEQCEPADLIIVAVKGYQLAQAVIDIKNHVGSNTVILSLLNGITSEEIIGKEYGMDKLLYALSFGLTANREGNQIHFTSYGNLAFGEKINLEYSQKVKDVKAVFEQAGIPFSIPQDMMRAIWWKFMVNVGINQCSAITGGRYHVFQTVDEAKNLMESAMWEVVRISEKTGIHLNGRDIKKWYEILNTLYPDSRTSMLEDIESGRKTEVDLFAATVCEMGEKYGVDTPINRTLLNIIKVIERR